ncbi:MAG: energy-coupling factor ABC transporter permease [Chloroflexi bacterium]|nr:energy-coupling factor ABC transporter permease [Chloroflexota bacterium]
MSHLHIPDGIIPPLWLALGFLVTGLMLALALRNVRDADSARRLPRLGIVAALMLIGMMAEIAVIGYHINLSVLAGILLGPWLGFIAAFLVNLILALFGHGGITVIGLNSLIIGSETILGWAVFRALTRNLNPRASAALTVVSTLALSTTLMLGIIALTQTQPALQFGGPESDAPLFQFELLPDKAQAISQIDLARFAQFVYFFGAIGWILEAVFTALVVGFFARVRPDLLASGARVVAAKENHFGTRAD